MPTLHDTVIRQHKTMRWQTQYGSVSIRKKSDGRYHVYCDDYENKKEIRADFATLRGAEIMANQLKESYLC
ncbi:hypothetical protein UFOVP253_69 [uncultured Caudovirales phage]|uniref:Uncharacterized protein n=1 Tax=uncultured Caudovirales phage TaxID=2100421 RepID=A0A6J5LDU0_9CAUD|nr:hypothetical protein UFOVP253_69 [uncultured Caudovirales phage]